MDAQPNNDYKNTEKRQKIGTSFFDGKLQLLGNPALNHLHHLENEGLVQIGDLSTQRVKPRDTIYFKK